MPDDGLVVTPRVTIPLNELQWSFSRSGGPGGQHVNTSSTQVDLIFNVESTTALPPFLKTRALENLADQLIDGTVRVRSSNGRSQFQNRRDAEQKLVALLQKAIAPPPVKRRATKPTKGSQQTRLQGKSIRGEVKRMRGKPKLDE